MKVSICDFCGKRAPEKTDTIFKHKGEQFRIAVLKVRIQNGVRWKEADTCTRCLRKYLKKVLK